MMRFLLYALLILLIILCIKFRVKIDLKSIFRKGALVFRGPYGIYDFDGPQGSGKTSSMVNFLYYRRKRKYYPVLFSNIKSLTVPGFKTEFFEGFNGIRDICRRIDNGSIPHKPVKYIVFDELLAYLSRASKIDSDIFEIIAQLRKRRIIILSTSQYWSSIPKDYRELSRYRIICRVFLFRYQINIYQDAENLHYNKETDDYDAPYIKTDIFKISKKCLNSYDTNERIFKS